MNLDFVVFAVLAFAAYRITRILVIDSIIATPRIKFHTFLVNRTGKLHWLAEKLYELTSCTWCTGVWVSLGLYSLYTWLAPWNFTRFDWIGVFAVAGAQGLLHAFEPDED